MRHDDGGREDLMTEAVSLVPRVEIQDPSSVDPVVLGLNKLGWLFVYFGYDPMYRFDDAGRLRRAYLEGRLYRTSGRTLAVMERQSDKGSANSEIRSESILLRRDLSQTELGEFQKRLQNELRGLRNRLVHAVILRQQPEGQSDLVRQFEHALDSVLESSEFLAPAIVLR